MPQPAEPKGSSPYQGNKETGSYGHLCCCKSCHIKVTSSLTSEEVRFSGETQIDSICDFDLSRWVRWGNVRQEHGKISQLEIVPSGTDLPSSRDDVALQYLSSVLPTAEWKVKFLLSTRPIVLSYLSSWKQAAFWMRQVSFQSRGRHSGLTDKLARCLPAPPWEVWANAGRSY